MHTTRVSTDQVQHLLTAHPGLLGEEPPHEQESYRVVHCMQCELQFQVEIDALDGRNGAHEGREEMLHITHIQRGPQQSTASLPGSER